MGFTWQVTPGQAYDQLVENYTRALFTTGRQVAQQRADEATAWMKANAPWTDRTGKARAGLHTDVLDTAGAVAHLVFSHGEEVPYGIWLEIANGGKYAIIAPAIDYFGPRLMLDLQRLVNLGHVTFGATPRG